MAKYQRFEELPVWQEAKELYNVVLDLLEESNVPLTPGFRNQLDRAALSVSNNVAEGFERSSTRELQAFITVARGSAGEVRSMMAVVTDRPKLQRHLVALQKIRALAESCARQLTAGPVPSTSSRSMENAICRKRNGPNRRRRRRRMSSGRIFSRTLSHRIRSTIHRRRGRREERGHRPFAICHLPSVICHLSSAICHYPRPAHHRANVSGARTSFVWRPSCQ